MIQNSAIPSQQVTSCVFLIRRLNIALQVVIRSTGLVKVEPFQCKDENLRLWTSIAKTQSVLAQTRLEQRKEGQLPLPVLYDLFQQHGWEIKAVEEQKTQPL